MTVKEKVDTMFRMLESGFISNIVITPTNDGHSVISFEGGAMKPETDIEYASDD